MAAIRDLTGQRFGRWLVLERDAQPGAARWRCRCDCGTLRTVAGKSLTGGVSTSCGCVHAERAASRRSDLTGSRFGKLLVLERGEKSDDGQPRWRCRCDCGAECLVLQKSLRQGKRTCCGCSSLKGRHAARDLTGQKFGMLTALQPTGARDAKGYVVWRCRCDCGAEAEVSLDRLLYSGVISCGCLRRKCAEALPERLTHVSGTSIDGLRSEKLRPDNKTGVRGVYNKRGKYAACITFQQKNYYLGSYAELATAAQVRKEAEETLHRGALMFYDRWKQRADRDPEWAAENPISFCVEREEDSGRFRVEMLPRIV